MLGGLLAFVIPPARGNNRCSVAHYTPHRCRTSQSPCRQRCRQYGSRDSSRDGSSRARSASSCRSSATRERGGPGRIRTYDQGIHAAPVFPPGVDYLFTPGPSTGRVRDARRLSSRALQPSGSLCTFRRCTAGLAQGCHQSRWKDSLNSSRSLHGFRREGTFFDESPALTAVLQAHGVDCTGQTSAAVIASAPGTGSKSLSASLLFYLRSGTSPSARMRSSSRRCAST